MPGGDDKRKAILDAAVRVFARQGYEASPVGDEGRLYLVCPVDRQGLLDDLQGPVRADRPLHSPEPTDTLRKRAGAAPWATRAVWGGWPFPQLGTPQMSHSPRPPMPSQLSQNSVVMPW